MNEFMWVKLFVIGVITYGSGIVIPEIQATFIPLVSVGVVAVSAAAIMITFCKSGTDSRVIIIRN